MPELHDILFAVEEEQVAVATERDLVAHPLELGERAERDADVQLVRELGADAARRLARRPGGERVALDEDNLVDAEPPQMKGGGGAEGAATDDHDVGREARRASGPCSGACRAVAWPRLRPRSTWS